jgi:hypothetical protein
MPFSEYAMHCLVKVAERRSGSVGGAWMSALEGVAREIAGRSGTRCKRLLGILAETPAMMGESLVRLPRRKGEPPLVQVERVREASSALDLARLRFPMNEALLGDLDTAKTTLRDSLRVERLRHIRRVVPDLGSAIVAVAVSAGDGEDRGLGCLSLPTLDWAIRSLKDLRDIVAEDDPSIRKESLAFLVAPEEDIDTAQQKSLAAVDAALEHLRSEFRNRESSGPSAHSGRPSVVLEPRRPLPPKV